MIENTASYRVIKLISPKKTIALTDYPEDIMIENTTCNSTDAILIENIEVAINLKYVYTTFITSLEKEIKEIIEKPANCLIKFFNLRFINNKPQITQLKIGKIDSFKIEDNKLIVEFTGISKTLSNKPTTQYLSTCKACFGDKYCGLNKSDYIIKNIAITDITKDGITIDTTKAIYSPKLQNIHRYELEKIVTMGYITNNDGLKMKKVIKFVGNQLTVAYPGDKPQLKIGDVINIQCICTKIFRDCKNMFNNQTQFMGEIYNYLPYPQNK